MLSLVPQILLACKLTYHSQHKCGSSSAGPSRTHTEQKGQEWTEPKRSTHTEAVNAAPCSRPVRRCGCFSDSPLCSKQNLSFSLQLLTVAALFLSLSLSVSLHRSAAGEESALKGLFTNRKQTIKKMWHTFIKPTERQVSLRKLNLSACSSLCLRPLCTLTSRCSFIAEISSLKSCTQISPSSNLKHCLSPVTE